MKKSYILPILAAGLLTVGCSKENPFDNGDSSKGQVLKSALAVSLNTDEMVRQKSTRADVSLNDFNIVFTRGGAPVAKYKYSEMPDVVTLPVGTYSCSATYGENRVAEWESPYYLGQSEEFEVESLEVTSYIDPIECKLENVKVTVSFDPVLVSRMSPDSYVEVKVGANEGLKYTTSEANSGKAGYFLHTAETTLVATFYGSVDGSKVSETKSYRDIQRGCHYKLNFKLHAGGDADDSGDADGEVVLDATVTTVDIERNVTVDDDPMEADWNEHPGHGGGDDPQQPDDPKADPPTIKGAGQVNVDAVNDGMDFINKGLPFILNLQSVADGGITGFTVDIQSGLLSTEELQGAGLDSHLDLVNPGGLAGVLQGLGLLVKLDSDGNPIYNSEGDPLPESSYLGYEKINFDLTRFLGLLAALGSDTHNFVVTVTDANGTTTKTVIIKM